MDYSMKKTIISLAAFPEKASPYTECFYQALRRRGVNVLEGDFSMSWLIRHWKKIDYFHFHWPSFCYAHTRDLVRTIYHFIRYLVYLIAIRLMGSQIIWTAHNLYPHDKDKWLFAFDKLGRYVITRLASIVLVHGPTAAKIVVKEFPSTNGKVVIIDHGNWINFYRNEATKTSARNEIGVPVDKFVYLFIGLCKQYKNIHTLVKTFKNVSGNVMLLIAGKFQEVSYYNEIAGMIKGKEDRIRLEGKYIADDDLQFYLNACDAVVLPYIDILTSGAAMLAISFGKPVIAPKKGYLKDMINEECGILYETQDKNGLVRAMGEVQKRHFDEGRIIQNARSFDWDKISEIVLQSLETSRMRGSQFRHEFKN